MKTLLITAIILSGLVGVQKCELEEGQINAIPSFQETAPMTELEQKQSFRKVSMRKGMPFFVELPSNSSTGYLWTLVNATALEKLRFMDKDATGKINKIRKQKKITSQRFAFLPLEVGNDQVEFAIENQKEDTTTPQTTFTINVSITIQ